MSPPDLDPLGRLCVFLNLDSAPGRGLALGTCLCLGFVQKVNFLQGGQRQPNLLRELLGASGLYSRWPDRDALDVACLSRLCTRLLTALSRARTYTLLFSVVVEYIISLHQGLAFLELRLCCY